MFCYLLPIVAFYIFYELKNFRNDNNLMLLILNLSFVISALVLSYIIQFNITPLPGVAAIVNFIGEKVLNFLF